MSSARSYVEMLTYLGTVKSYLGGAVFHAAPNKKFKVLDYLTKAKETLEDKLKRLQDDKLLTEIEAKYKYGIPSMIEKIKAALDNPRTSGVKQNIDYAMHIIETENYERIKELCEASVKLIESVSSETEFIESIPYRIDTKWLAEIYEEKMKSPLFKKLPHLEYTPESKSESKSKVKNKKIFIVHGRDNSSKFALKDLLRDWGLEPIILHEQPNKGRTIIEKFEDYSDVSYTIVILTPDDKGHHKSSKKLNLRARQNVILELGFFYGKLGRDKVTCLYKKGVEKPSDIDGIMYIPFDRDLKKEVYEELRKELRNVGFEIKD